MGKKETENTLWLLLRQAGAKKIQPHATKQEKQNEVGKFTIIQMTEPANTHQVRPVHSYWCLFLLKFRAAARLGLPSLPLAEM